MTNEQEVQKVDIINSESFMSFCKENGFRHWECKKGLTKAGMPYSGLQSGTFYLPVATAIKGITAKEAIARALELQVVHFSDGHHCLCAASQETVDSADFDW